MTLRSKIALYLKNTSGRATKSQQLTPDEKSDIGTGHAGMNRGGRRTGIDRAKSAADGNGMT